MKPNLETMIEVLSQKIAQAEIVSAQWQSIALDQQKELEELKNKTDE